LIAVREIPRRRVNFRGSDAARAEIPAEHTGFLNFLSGTVSAVVAGIVRSAGRILSMVALLVAMTGNLTATAFAGEIHPICATKQHDCGTATKITPCCCADQPASQIQSTPVSGRVELRADVASTPAILNVIAVPIAHAIATRSDTSPPHRHLVDLPARFSSFLI